MVSGTGENCACPKAITLLVRLGAMHTARMHAAGAAAFPNQWSAEQWYQHMDEEEKLFFPLLPKMVRDQFVAQHARFRKELAIYYRITSIDLLEDHSRAEDEWAVYLLQHMSKPADDKAARVAGIDRAQKMAVNAIPFATAGGLFGAVLWGIKGIVIGAVAGAALGAFAASMEP
jgi:uncharacterized iron-regulated membrane protein